MRARLYTLRLSHPGRAALGMLRFKGVETEVKTVPEGLHPIVLKARGFRGITVPAIRLDTGEKLQLSRLISKRLDELVPEGPQLHTGPKVDAAEQWGDQVFQSLPRRIFRWAASEQPPLREWIARQAGIPAPGVTARISGFQARAFAKQAKTSRTQVEADLQHLPAALDEVDGLLAAGVIGGDQPNAADFQIFATVKSLLGFEDLRGYVEGRPCEPAAAALIGDWPDAVVPSFLPPELKRATS